MNTPQNNPSGDFSLLRLVPTVLRARDFRLYAAGDVRLVDLWQNGGAAILGHTPPSILRELKNTASRGLYAPFPHFMEGRFVKALPRLFPGRSFRLYASPPSALEEMAHDGRAALWRPCVNPAAPLSVPENAPPVLIPVLPGIQGWHSYQHGESHGYLPQGLCVLALDSSFEKTAALPCADFLSPILLAVAARGLYDLIASAAERANPTFPRIAKALKNSQTKNSIWQRQGIYLSLRQAPTHEEWAAMFRRFLDAGFLLPPDPSQPLILPGVLSPGEEAKLAALILQ